MSGVVASLAVLLGLLVGTYCVAVLDRLSSVGTRGFSHSVLAPFAEAAVMMRREEAVPSGADRFLYCSAPIVALAAVAVAGLVIPLGPNLVAFDPNIGLFYFIVVLGPFVPALMNAGWAQNSKVGLFATFRAAAHLVSYEVPLGFAAIGPVMAAQSLSMMRIVEEQSGLWYGVWQPLGVAIFLPAALFMSYRHPFDIPQGGTELEGGVLAEYSGPRLLLFRFSLDALFLLLMAAAVVLFFGGWAGPLLPGPVWFVLKTVALTCLVLWAGRRFPRLRHDQMLGFAWKVLLPASLVNVGAVGLALLAMGGVS